jgi:translation initiation factor 1
MGTDKNTRPAGSASVRVGREVAGRGGKGVSVISGLPLAGADLEALAIRLKKLCGAGGRVVYRRAPAQGSSRSGERADTESAQGFRGAGIAQRNGRAGSASRDRDLRAARDGVIEIQGEHRDRLVAQLRQLGYDAKRSGG